MLRDTRQSQKDKYCLSGHTDRRMMVARGWGKRRKASYYLLGTEFQCCERKRSAARRLGCLRGHPTAADQREFAQNECCRGRRADTTECAQVAKMVPFMLRAFYHNFRKRRKRKRTQSLS